MPCIPAWERNPLSATPTTCRRISMNAHSQKTQCKLPAPQKSDFSEKERQAIAVAKALISCFLRSYLVSAGFNAHGMQNLGFIYAMEPGLRIIYSDQEKLIEARDRYIAHYNTHPFWTPLLLGIFLRAEKNIHAGVLPVQALLAMKDTASYTLSAIGDSVFTGTLLPFWAFGASCLLVSGHHVWAFIFSALLFALLQAFRLYTFVLGLRTGIMALMRVRQMRLIDWGQRMKLANAVLLALFLRLIAPAGIGPEIFYSVCATLCIAAWCVARKNIPRLALAGILLGIWSVGYLI